MKMADLVKRLREWTKYGWSDSVNSMEEAADRIEQLEEGQEKFIKMISDLSKDKGTLIAIVEAWMSGYNPVHVGGVTKEVLARMEKQHD